jgi:hypothetical protein
MFQSLWLFRFPLSWGLCPQTPIVGKNRFAVFPNRLPSPTATFIPSTGTFIPHNPCHGFCLCGGERCAKTTPPLRDRDFFHSHTGAFIGFINRIQKIG